MSNTVMLVDAGSIEFRQAIKEMIQEAIKETFGGMQKTDKKIEGLKVYRLDSPEVWEMFGVSPDHKTPTRTIINMLRSAGIEPLKHGRNGTKVFGSQITQYLESVKIKNNSYTKQN